jgi:hypothetical protein
MKKTIMNMMFTTGISIFGLTLYFLIIHEESVLVKTLLQLTGANVLIHLSLYLRDKFEIRNPFIESIIDNSIIIVILIVFGLIFGWFVKVPIWLLVISGIVYYIITSIITVSKTKRDTDEVNEILNKINGEE